MKKRDELEGAEMILVGCITFGAFLLTLFVVGIGLGTILYMLTS